MFALDRGRSLAALALAGTLSACGGGGSSTAETAGIAGPASAGSAAQDATAAGIATALAAARKTAPVVQPTTAVIRMEPARNPGQITVRARAELAGNVGPIVEIRVNGTLAARGEIRSTTFQDHTYQLSTPIAPGARVDVIYTNDANVGAQDRNLFVSHVRSGNVWLSSSDPGVTIDIGAGAAATDGRETLPGQTGLYWSAALRYVWPATVPVPEARAKDVVRLLQQASFGPTYADVQSLMGMTDAQWITAQMAQPYSASFVDAVQRKYDLGAAYRPSGAQYQTTWVGNAMWKGAAAAPDQLRRRVAYALQQIFVVSQAHDDIYGHQRPYARYLDVLAEGAFGNYRQLLENVALSPATALYLSYLRNQKGDPATGRKPDENFAREVMQLFSIGLVELNTDGTPKRDSAGRPIETYTNDDVEAMATVMTGWSWGFDQTNGHNFFNVWPDYAATGSARVDLRPLRGYPEFHATQQVVLFAGKPWAVTVPASTTPATRLRAALDGLFNHPNVGPFMARQLIQRLVTSNPSPAYVARVAAVFNNNGQGVRGDLGAVVRALLLDTEARAFAQPANAGKLSEPLLRVTQWMRAFNARSSSGEYLMNGELTTLMQRPFYQPSVFNFYRPGYVAPNTRTAAANLVAPEFQITNESTTAAWVNMAGSLASGGIGWNGSAPDVRSALDAEVALIAASGSQAWIERLNLLLFAGRMSDPLRTLLYEAMAGVGLRATTATPAADRIRLTIQLALSSAEFQIQK